MGKNDKQQNQNKSQSNNAARNDATPADSTETSKPAVDVAATEQTQTEQVQGEQIEQTSTETASDNSQTSSDNATGESSQGDTAQEPSAPVDAPVIETTPAPVVEEPKAEEPKAEDKPVGSVVETPRPIGLQRNTQDSSLLNSFAHQLEEYCAKMGRAVPVTALDGAAHQLALYRLICTILRQEGTVFTKAWSMFLQTVHEQAEGAFSHNRALRFFEHVKLDAAAKTAFQHLLYMAMATADPKSRAVALRTIQISSATAGLPVPGATEKLEAFYAP